MIRRAIASRLEAGRFDSRAANLASRVWEKFSNPVRPLELPERARVIGIGGATLGGSEKTPLVLAFAERLRDEARVVVVASGYRARVTRRVRPDDAVRDVGDEALW